MKKYSLLILSLLLSLSVAAQRGRQLPLPDYSYCGYQASEAAIPMVPIKAVVPATDQDATASIQAALDYVASLPVDEQGFRGAVLLEKGTYRISQTLWIKASGVVLRGSGISSEGTELLSTSRDRLTMIRVKGQDDRTFDKDKSAQVVATAPVGAMSLSLSEQVFRQGDRVIIQQFPNVSWERTVTDVKGKTIHLDAPITYELTSDKPAMVSLLSWPGRIEGVGIENLRINSVYDETNLMDENHAWIGIALENVRDAWVRAVEFRHLAGSAVFVAETASRVTVQDCKSLEPISEIGAQRRYSFYVKGSQVLCQRIQAEEGYHDFAVAASHGPNAFVQCWSLMPYSYSGCVESWSSGVLFDICSVSGNALRTNIPNYADAFAGWTTTNTTFWNSTASMVSCVKPQVAGNNYAYGAWGQFNGRGHWESPNSHVNPWSLYYTQLERRLGKASPEADKLIGLGRGGTSSIQDAAYQTAKARRPLTMLSTWIDSLLMADPFVVSYDDKALTQVWQSFVKAPKEAKDYPSIELKDGILQRDGKILTGGRRGCTWWRGNPRQTAQSDPHLVRYALGPEGYGLVDDLKDVTDFMKEKNILVTDFHYALWLDRRRDDHQRTARIDGEQRAPFYELPFARSGQGRAWDGLSLYDLTKWNNWYWNRLATYADLAEEKGLMLFYQHYFQHNILEAGGHWA
ncbi:MAG: pectate lyase, partial [Bacteroidales bacterium]|nr:pectate lyase [Bacteroidales bacterium]